ECQQPLVVEFRTVAAGLCDLEWETQFIVDKEPIAKRGRTMPLAVCCDAPIEFDSVVLAADIPGAVTLVDHVQNFEQRKCCLTKPARRNGGGHGAAHVVRCKQPGPRRD